MGFKKKVDKNGIPVYCFIDFYGAGWIEEFEKILIEKILIEKIHPKNISTNTLNAGWHSSTIEIVFLKKNINYSIFVDEADLIQLKPLGKNFIMNDVDGIVKILDSELKKKL